jgi:hypothetical protein
VSIAPRLVVVVQVHRVRIVSLLAREVLVVLGDSHLLQVIRYTMQVGAVVLVILPPQVVPVVPVVVVLVVIQQVVLVVSLVLTEPTIQVVVVVVVLVMVYLVVRVEMV